MFRTLLFLVSSFVIVLSIYAQPPGIQNGGFQAFELNTFNHLAPRAWHPSEGRDGDVFGIVMPQPHGPVLVIRPGAGVMQTITIPAPAADDNSSKPTDPASEYWLVSLDVLGVYDADGSGDPKAAADAAVELMIMDDQGRILGGQVVTAAGLQLVSPAPKQLGFHVTTSSEENDSLAVYAFDSNPQTIWHTAYRSDQPTHPHYLIMQFDKPQRVEKLRYQPREGGGNGTLDGYALYVSEDGIDWGEPVVEGRFGRENPSAEKVVELPKPMEASMFMLEARREVRGGPWASAAEIELLPRGDAMKPTQSQRQGPSDKPRPIRRGFVMIPQAQIAKLAGRSLQVKLRGLGHGEVVVDNINLQPMWTKPGQEHLGRSNGGVGPDWFEAAPLGFAGLLIHRSTVLPVAKVRKDTPASKADLEPGDLIIAVNGQPLGTNDCHPGWNWVEHGHEMTLGRALIDSLAQARKAGDPAVMELDVLRDGQAMSLTLELSHPGGPKDTFAFDDAVAKQMHRDLCERVLKDMKPNGDHGGFVRSGLGGLALLSARDPSYAQAIKRTADWFLNRYPTPDRLDSYQFWPLAYAGIFMAEYYLATGDERVLPWMQRNLDWVMGASHKSRPGMMALGHDPGGLPYGYKSLVAPAAHCLVFEALAERCGLEGELYEHIEDYMRYCWSDPAEGGHGGMGYNFSYKDRSEFWSRTGLTMLALHLRGIEPQWIEGCAGIMEERWPWFRNSHAYGEPGGALGLAAMSTVKPDVFQRILRELGPSLMIAWEPGYGMRFTMPHMGMPYMESDNAYSACYAIVLSAANKGLHLTGSTDRNWLDVRHLATPITPIHAMRSRDNRVALSCDVPGPTIRYTTDGSEPDHNALPYTQPFEFKQAGIIKAQAFNEHGEAGPVQKFRFGLSKQDWKIVEASGGSTPQEAVRRASFLIDGDPATVWMADRGFEMMPYPQHVIVDLGDPTTFGELRLDVRGGRMHPIRKWQLHTSDDGQTWQEEPVMAGDWPQDSHTLAIQTDGDLSARLLKITAVEGEHGMAFSELELYPPVEPQISQPQETQPQWKLIWQDEFETHGHPDPQKWDYEEGFVRNREAQIYTRRNLDNVRVKDGVLIIEGHRKRAKNPNYRPNPSWWAQEDEYAQYTSGSINTLGKASFLYGRIEVRAKLPHGRGVWPAIWMMGENINQVGWPLCGEIDIMEFVGKEPKRIYGTVHRPFPEDPGKNYRTKGGHIDVDKPWEQFHIYAIEWWPDRIDFFFDDTKYFTYDLEEAGEGQDNPFRKPQYLLINLALGGSWGGAIDDSIFPVQYLVDYVRVYQWQNHEPAD